MQLTEGAAQEWAEDSKKENFRVEELFDPKTNLEAGSWYLRRAMDHWQNQEDPIPFALAEYNAGASRAQRWAGGADAKGIPGGYVPGEYRFPRDAQIRGLDHCPLRVLQAAWTDVALERRSVTAGSDTLIAAGGHRPPLQLRLKVA